MCAKFLSRVRRGSVSYPGVTCVGNKPGCSTPGLRPGVQRPGFGQSAQAEQDALILYSSQESVRSRGKISRQRTHLAAAPPSRGKITRFSPVRARQQHCAHRCRGHEKDASSTPLHERNCSGTLPEQGRARQAAARSTARLCIRDAHSTKQQAAAARSTPPSRCCCRLPSALLHSANRAETLPERELRLEERMIKRALLVA